jgi:hypothetical protein
MAITTTRETLHRLVDALPSQALERAARYLEAATTDDPVWRAILLAPEDDEPETEYERQARAEADADAAAGRLVPKVETEQMV